MTDRLREIAAELSAEVRGGYNNMHDEWRFDLQDHSAENRIHQALLSVRDEALEEAAVEATAYRLGMENVQEGIQRAIRSLKSKSLDHPA